MKLLVTNIETADLEVMKELLESNGIPAFINGQNTARMIPLSFIKATLWVHLEGQADEALLLINNPEYEVINKVDIDEYYKFADNVKRNPENLSNAYGNLAVSIGAVLLGMFILIKILQWLNT